MKTKNGIEITYNEVGDVVIKIDFANRKNENNFSLYNNIMDELGDCDIVTCNEINGNEPDMLIDSDRNVFLFQIKEISDLKTKGETELVKQGVLRDFIDLENKYHIDFLKWYYCYDTAEEAINAMQTEIFN